MLPDNIYNFLKKICIVFLPACGTLLFTLGSIFGWEWSGTAVGVISAVDTFLGTILGISTAQYNARKEDSDDDK